MTSMKKVLLLIFINVLLKSSSGLILLSEVVNGLELKEVVPKECFFDNVFVEYYDNNGRNYETTINECIKNTSFESTKVSHIEISLQYIPNLLNGSISNLPDLESILIIKSGIDSIEPGSFSNLPKIKNISLVFNDFYEVKKGVFNDLPVRKVLISSPSLKSIEENAFFGMKNLTTVAIHYSRITKWNKNWIGYSETLTGIDFRFGLLQVLPGDGLESLPNLKYISFRDNQLHIIENGVFQGFKTLEYLGLNSNRLSDLNPKAFPESLHINVLNIEKNKLNYLPQKFLKKVTSKKLYIWGNPWTCSCFDSIKQWLKANNGSIQDNYNCIDYRNPVCIMTEDDTCIEAADGAVSKVFSRKFSQKRMCVVPVPFF